MALLELGGLRRRIRDGKRSGTAEFQRALLQVKEYEIEVKAATLDAEKLKAETQTAAIQSSTGQ